ncbi:MAG: NADH-quinone oxidoreductase subunit L [Firmicutes bacterium]|jgi:NADH:ubiquinone oxidoreductase subunit 5 (subunit L)/multisubunit Na+/H+ antiporter MnhA subunit|nr:NADH-quinone oxidoreductase subunit L [Bacillota bacterium]
MGSEIIIACICVPLCGSFLLPLLGIINAKLRNFAALAFTVTAFLCAAFALPAVFDGSPLNIHFELPLGLSFGFYADVLAVFMALTSSFVASIIVLYSFDYIKPYEHQNEYYMMVCLFIGTMMGLVFSTNLIFIYIFWEISAICCWRLIGFYREEITIRRANKAFVVTVLGALIMLVGFVGIYGNTGTFDLAAMKGTHIPAWIVVLILCGVLSKSATFPLHNWLPDAGVAPSPVTSLLHAAVLVKIGVYIYARLFVNSLAIDKVFTVAVPVIAAVSALVSAGVALRENDIKRIIAYSTISQLAFILLGLSAGTEIGVLGGLLYILMHSVAKGGLFLCAGIVEHSLHTKDITKMGGLYKRMPLTALAFIFCAFSVMGIPPFGGFFAKYLVIDGIVSAGNTGLGAVFIAGAVMTILYLSRLFIKVFLGESPSRLEVKEGSPLMVASVLILAILSVALGLSISWPSGFVALIGGGI